MLAAVLFDFDGLIVDTESAAFEAWGGLYADHGVALELEQWVRCVGSDYSTGFDPVTNLARLLRDRGDPRADTLDRPALIAAKEALKKAACDRLGTMAGFQDRITEARRLGLKTGVASSSSRAWVGGHIERLGLHACFDIMRTRDDVVHIKPSPEVYLSAATGLGVAPAACLVLEDSQNGVRAAKAAGMRCIAVPNSVTRASDFSAADVVSASLAAVRFADFL